MDSVQGINESGNTKLQEYSKFIVALAMTLNLHF
jgi:hypothetical protein